MSSNDSRTNDRGARPRISSPPWPALVLGALSACTGSNRVQYADGRCLIDGVVASLTQVETHQAEVTQHILSRQPVLTGIAIAAVALAGASYVQRILSVLAARRSPEDGFGERLRRRMARYREHPVRYFLLLGLVLTLLLVAGAAYISMDADKRASERALTNLQFCHLALRTADEQRALSEQRDNLASIQSTATDIRALVDKLPPDEQNKAHDIVDQLSSALGQQRVLVGRYAQHADDAARQVTEHQVEVQAGLSKLEGDVIDLKSTPAQIAKLGDAVGAVEQRSDAIDEAVAKSNAKLDALAKSLDALASRPALVCPACTCGGVLGPVAAVPASSVGHPADATEGTDHHAGSAVSTEPIPPTTPVEHHTGSAAPPEPADHHPPIAH